MIKHNEKEYIYTYLHHFAGQQKLTQHCKLTILHKNSVSFLFSVSFFCFLLFYTFIKIFKKLFRLLKNIFQSGGYKLFQCDFNWYLTGGEAECIE